MELCATRGLSTPLSLSSHRVSNCHFRLYPSLPLHNPNRFSGVSCRENKVVRVSSDDENGKFTEERRDGVATLEDVPSIDKDITLDKVSPVFNEFKQPEQPRAEVSSSDDEQAQPFQELLDYLNIELDSENSYKLLLYGGGGLAAVWLLSAIVGAIDSIPVVPKLMEVVGLGYSVWFTTRYLLFKKNREELAAKFDALKQDVLGSSDD